MPKVTTEAGTLQNVTIDGKIVGFKFGVRLPRYRGNMLSLINGYYVTVDGEEFPQSAIKMEVNGKPPRSFDEIKKAVWEHWDFQETAYLHISKPEDLSQECMRFWRSSQTLSSTATTRCKTKNVLMKLWCPQLPAQVLADRVFR